MKSWVWAPSLMVQISYEMITGSVFYEVPHSQRPFIENMTVTWSSRSGIFLEGILLPSAEKRVKQEPVPYTHENVTFLKRRFASFDGKKKGDPGAAALNGGKYKCSLSCLHGIT